MARPFHYDRDFGHGAWHDRDWRDHARRDNDGWRWGHRHYYGRDYGERACWYQRW